jgi:hypothetical protein
MRNNRLSGDYWITDEGNARRAYNSENNKYGHKEAAWELIGKMNNLTREETLRQYPKPTEYAIEHYHWICIRGNTIEAKQYNQQTKDQLQKGLKQILQKNNIPETANIIFELWTTGSKRATTLPMHDIFSPDFHIPQNTPEAEIQYTQQNQFRKANPPKISNLQQQLKHNKLLPPGHQLWRGTSESATFYDWLENQ